MEGKKAKRSQADESQQPSKPWNLMIKHRHVHRRGRRSHMAVSYTDPQVSMDLLRAVLQPSFNDDIMAVFRKYHTFFEKAAHNVKENIGDEVHADQLIKEACRNVLEHAKVLFPESEAKKPSCEVSVKRPRGCEESSSQRGSPVPKKRKNRTSGAVASDRSFNISAHVKAKCEAIKKEGPKWEPSRLNESSTFVLGSRANKALGMGGTRGRIYIKHADLFKYAADTRDKQWLAERHHMRATGGKMAYLLIEEDVQDLARGDDYKDCPDVKLEEMKPFSVPLWMVEKMQRAMEAQRDTEF
ncbi:deoxynucleotidyltransferase terminal-interacting protein 1 isoform X1 [Syngnathus scovelli]|uniref:deoxynucleotidyltransferase terminal-interacting protein 1 isoform X1 n=2 Tax=Syngnathus scovelli TaxID=161590 RepID=UPI00210FDD50|nr:deoxynucleotidyltransferase terminal-interacting protein 1 isoform X1 [Syngnathus scovelli]XP_049590809.1 deoxynucleotidyltransferase terminal-interacting protein 1 isoform X1 [Syngnathus scovelli]